jgi:CHAT domain-containing protein
MMDVGTAGAELIDQLGSQSSRRAMVAFLRHQPQLWDPAVVESLYERVVRVARADLRQAERLADAAAWLAEKLGDDRCRAQSLRAVGHVLLIGRRYGEALKRYDAALQLFRAAGQDIDVGRTLSGGVLHSLIYLGRFDDALASAREARRIFERHGDLLRLARLDSNMGNILGRQNRFQEALALYERAHEQLADIGEPQDVAAVLGNMAVCYMSLYEFQKALDSYQKARLYCQTHDMPLLIAQIDYNIAYLHYLRGEYTRALELYRAAEKQSDEVGDAYHRALCDLDRSELYLELNLIDEAQDLAARALVRFEKLGLAYEAAKAVTNLATAASRQGETERALQLFDRARELFTAEGNQVWLALVDFYQALVLYRDERYLQAQRLCQSALKLFARASLPGKAALCELLLARLELDAGDPRAAEQACRAALERAEATQSPMLNYRAYFVLGLIREAQREPQAAYAAFERSSAGLEQLRSHLGADDLKVAFLKDKLAVYESLVAIGLKLGPERQRQEAAFGYIEQAKSRSLADLIAFRASTLAPRVESDLGDEVRRLRQQINWHARQIELEELTREKRSARRIETLRRRTRTLENDLVKSLQAVRATDQEFAALQGGAAFSLEEIREVVTPGTVLLEYYQARGQIYACVLSRERLDVVPVASALVVRKLLRLLQFQLSKCALGSQYPGTAAHRLRGATEAHLSELYTILVAPIRDRLHADHLVIVPHDLLHYLPFHALYDGARFLIDEFTISYAPSASVYRLCCAKRPRSGGEALVMGVPDARTPYIVEEIQAVARTFPRARVFLGEEATADRLAAYGPTSPFVHMATHGLFRRDNPMFSSIRLGSGPLSVIDLYQLRLSAELVTLSGCSTGLNAIVGGDELLGLVRGLLYAGAQAVLLTLWDAYDMSTADFMESFYGHLQSGSNKARAVQLAMRDLREQYPHPFYWAPFTLIGQANQS